jgi:hypothetical protein
MYRALGLFKWQVPLYIYYIIVSLIPFADLSTSLGFHNLLTSLELVINISDLPSWLLHRLLYKAQLPALKHMVIGVGAILFERVTINVPQDSPPILSKPVAHGLNSLTFCFHGNPKFSIITFTNWVQFQDLFDVRADSRVVRYELGSNCVRLPRLLSAAAEVGTCKGC